MAVALLAVATPSYPVARWGRQRWHHTRVPIRAIAVMPLENFPNGPTQEFFSDGMTEALITELGRVHPERRDLPAVGAAFQGHNQNGPSNWKRVASGRLGAEGSALREGGKVRISVQLVRVNPEEQVRAQNYERDVRDVIALQRKISCGASNEPRPTFLRPQQPE